MEPEQVFWLVLLATPFSTVLAIALLRGYHVWIHLYRGKDVRPFEVREGRDRDDD